MATIFMSWKVAAALMVLPLFFAVVFGVALVVAMCFGAMECDASYAELHRGGGLEEES